MNKEQMLPAFVAQLLFQGVDPNKINRAVYRVIDLRIGDSISGNDPLYEAFAFRTAERLENACK